MVRKNTVLTLGIISIVILLTIQVIIAIGVWKQKDEMFNLRYRLYSQDALSSMARRWGTDGFDTARLLISAYSEKAAKQISDAKSDTSIQRMKDDALYFTEKVLNKEQDLSPYLPV